jgi:hypothetical protein
MGDATGVSEWMWLRIDHCDEQRQIVFGWLENPPDSDQQKPAKVEQLLAATFAKILEHRKRYEFEATA